MIRLLSEIETRPKRQYDEQRDGDKNLDIESGWEFEA